MEEKKELFETMPVPKALFTLAVPTIISQLITMIYNLADTFFIGQTQDPYKVAAASVAYTLFFVLTALSNLFGVGGGSLISRLLGRGQHEEAKRVSSFSFYGAVVVSGIYAFCCWAFMNPLLGMLGASSSTLGFARDYAFWVVVIGGVPSTLNMTMAHLLRSEGYAKQASFGLGLGGVLNIILDPLFMFVILPKGEEVKGAAVATMLSNVIALLYFAVVFYLLRKKTVLSVSPRHVIPRGEDIISVFAVGFPSALGTLLVSVSNTVVNKLASSYDDIAVAAVGIVKKVEMLPINVGMGLCQGMMPLVAYNYAAKNYHRMRAVTKHARLYGMAFALLCIVVFELFAQELVRLFINDAPTIALGTNFLRINCLATPLMINNFQMSYTFQAMGKGKESLFLSACRQGIINIPLLFFMNYLFGLYGVIWTQLIADALTLILSFALYRHVYSHLPSD